MTAIVYKITNNISGTSYIGVTRRPLRVRWKAHCNIAKRNPKVYLHTAMKLYGIENFSIEEICSALDVNFLSELEQYFIAECKTLNPAGYNLTIGGTGTPGHKFTEEQLKKLSQSHMGFKHSNEAKKKIAASSSVRNHTENAKQKISDFHKALWENPEYREKHAQKIRMICKTESHKKKQKENFAKLMQDEKFKAKWVGAHTGHSHAKETREKMREARNIFLQNNERARELSGKLKINDVMNIRLLLSTGVSAPKIALQYSVSKSLIYQIKYNIIWKDVPAECA